MLLRRWEPFNEIRRFDEAMDRLWNGVPYRDRGRSAMPLDVVENDGDIIVRATIPGAKPEEIQVTIENHVLTIKGETSEEHVKKDGDYLMRERRTGGFHRALRLPDTVDVDKAESRYEHGVLTVTLPKVEAKKAKRLKGQAP